LALIQKRKEEGDQSASLIIMPTSLIHNWQSEAKKFTPKLKVLPYTGTDRIKSTAQFDKYDLILTSYGIARIDKELLNSYRFNYIILDESQIIKNPSSQIAKAVKMLNADHHLLLSGTPIENKVMDLWSQMDFANTGLLGGHAFFKKMFASPIERGVADGTAERMYSIIKPFILRRTKEQVAKELPSKIQQVHYCEMEESQFKFYDETKSKYRNEILKSITKQGFNKARFSILQGLMKLRQIANHPIMVDEFFRGQSGKFEEVVRMLESVTSEGHKVLLFSQFVKFLTLFRRYLDGTGLNYEYLDGNTRNRKDIIQNFQSNDEIKLFLISLKAGGLGLNLTAADYVFIVDPWWNPAVEAQAIDRTHRIGQDKTIFTYKFITKNTVEEKILALQKRKAALAEQFIVSEESFFKSLSEQDIKDILD